MVSQERTNANLVLLTATVLVAIGLANAAQIKVLNQSFEYVGGVPVTVKTMGIKPDDWDFGNGMPTGGGIENPSSEGAVCVAVKNIDSVYQLTDHTIVEGEQYTLIFDAYFLWSGGVYDSTYQGRLYYGNGGSRTVIDFVESNLSAGMPDYSWYDHTLTTTIPAGHAAIGSKLGIELATINNSGATGSWLGFDNVRLSMPRTVAATFYVDSATGDDGNTGLATDQAWATLAPVNAMDFIPGDHILFKAGTTYTGQLKPQGSGVDGNPIIIDMYETGSKPLIAGQGLVNPTLLLDNIEYIEVNNLEITNEGATAQAGRMGVYIHLNNFGTAHDVKIRDLYVHDVNGSNIKSEGGGFGIKWHIEGDSVQSRFDGLLIENCHLERCDRDGIKGGGSYWTRDNWYPSLNVIVRGNLLEDIGGDCIVPVCTDGALIEYNVVRNGGQRAPQGDACAGIWPWSADNTVIQYNEVSGQRGYWDAQGFDSDWNCLNTLIQYNYSHDNMGGFLLICSNGGSSWPYNIGNDGTIVRYNLSVDDGYQESVISPTFHISGSVTNTQIYNNTIYIGTRDVIDIFDFSNWGGPWPENTYVYNNIFYVAGSASNSNMTDPTNTVFSNNLWYGTISNLPSGETNRLTSDPMLVNPGTFVADDYKLRTGSPAINSGIEIAGNGGIDFWENQVPYEITDRGAHEFLPGDLNGNHRVDLEDVAELGAQWQTGYDMSTLLEITNNWLYGTLP